MQNTDRLFERSLEFIAAQQERNGSFASLSSNDFDFSQPKIFHTTFFTSLILQSLSGLNIQNKFLSSIKKRGVEFLLKEKSINWSFNYWQRNSIESKTMPYPDDLDDTFGALSAIFLTDSKILSGESFAGVTKILTALEIKEGGPYKTWLVPPNGLSYWQDVDLAVNANIGYFLSLQGVHLESIEKFINEAIDRDDCNSPYYPSIYPVIYFISRFYKGNKKEKIISRLLASRAGGYWQNPLWTSLAISALYNLGCGNKKVFSEAVSYLLASRQKNSSWKPIPFCFDPDINQKASYAGAATLTTAFVLEALNKYRDSSIQNITVPNKNIAAITILAKDSFNFNGDEMKRTAAEIIETILKKDVNNEIILLAQHFYQSLKNDCPEKISDKTLIKLGAANLFGWIAYSIYDDFLDKTGKAQLLPITNVCLVRLIEIYNEILPKSCVPYFYRTLNRIETANFIEQECRPKIKNDIEFLAEKSIGHAFGPLSILLLLGFRPESEEMKNLESFFKHYLIARQLNDDAHDWQGDLEKGILNVVSVKLISDWKKKYPKKRGLNLKNDLIDLQKIFWSSTVRWVARLIKNQTKLARISMKKLDRIILNYHFFETLLEPIEKAVDKALIESQRIDNFIDNYQ